jgi:hypothetical protein
MSAHTVEGETAENAAKSGRVFLLHVRRRQDLD